jgi:hypothetical protein
MMILLPLAFNARALHDGLTFGRLIEHLAAANINVRSDKMARSI